ncbi:response regulator transcription factor [Flavobacteriaceae bacterium MHTCC 0001]
MINIVIVDDHSMFLEGISTMLSKHENIHIIKAVNNADDALMVLKQHTPDLLITDISMPNMNGVEFIKIVNETFPELKILVISVFKQIHAFNGIKGYLLKDTGYDELVAAIHTIVIDGKTYFYKGYTKEKEVLDFNSSILSSREKEIVRLMAKELTVGEIAEQLFLSRYTVETHKKNIYQKLQVNNAAGLVKKAVYLGYIDE